MLDSTQLPIWTPVPGMETLYRVSDQGDVESLGRWIDRRVGPYWKSGRQMAQQRLQYEHLAVRLTNEDGVVVRYYVHRLVLLAFVGPPPAGKPEGCHNDGNAANNRLENLRWDSHAGNMRDMVEHGTTTARERCVRNHRLVEPNLLWSVLGWRECLACSRSNDARRDLTDDERRILADGHYRHIIGVLDPDWHSDAPALPYNASGQRPHPHDWSQADIDFVMTTTLTAREAGMRIGRTKGAVQQMKAAQYKRRAA